jgi:hypothetical protein
MQNDLLIKLQNKDIILMENSIIPQFKSISALKPDKYIKNSAISYHINKKNKTNIS